MLDIIVAGLPLARPVTEVIEAPPQPLTLETLSIIVGACVATALIAVTCALVVRSWVSEAKGIAYAIGHEITAKLNDIDRKNARRMTRHNREDDDRFDFLNTQLWMLRVRNAEKDNKLRPEFQPLPRRRNDYDDDEDSSDLKRAGFVPFEPGELDRPEADRPGGGLIKDGE